jgi:hypothetical protein
MHAAHAYAYVYIVQKSTVLNKPTTYRIRQQFASTTNVKPRLHTTPHNLNPPNPFLSLQSTRYKMQLNVTLKPCILLHQRLRCNVGHDANANAMQTIS